MINIERVAELIREAYRPHHRAGGMVPWAEVPDDRKRKWREMAEAAIKEVQRQQASDERYDGLS